MASEDATERLIATVSEFSDGDKRLVAIDGVEIGVFRLGDAFFAWRNVCPHQGGPVCQGRIFKRVIEKVDAEGKVHDRSYDEHARHIVCPWHGGEFDIRTGHHAGTNQLALHPVEATVREGRVYLRVE